MRARMALFIAGIGVELREVKLAAKPAALIAASPKATVPVLVLPDGRVIDESIAIMRWALNINDPEDWLSRDDQSLIERNDGAFKHHLDRYKYPSRYADEPGIESADHRGKGLAILKDLDARLEEHGQLCGTRRGLSDIAIFPFIRQFANTDRAWFDDQVLPHCSQWLQGHMASELFAAIMPKYAVWQPEDEPVFFGA